LADVDYQPDIDLESKQRKSGDRFLGAEIVLTATLYESQLFVESVALRQRVLGEFSSNGIRSLPTFTGA